MFEELIILVIAAMVTGVLVKFADIMEDHHHPIHPKLTSLISIIFGIFYGVIIALFIFKWPIVIPLAIGTVAGLFFSRKFDAVGHYFGILVFMLLAGHLYFTINNFLEFNIIFLSLVIVFVIANVLEEFVNDFLDNPKSKKHPLLKKFPKLRKLLEYRLILEITALLTSFLLGQWLIWITIFSFDVGYHTIEKTIGKRWGKPKKKEKKHFFRF
jgi:ABC-type uncharacterized transport system fused permease/ATPase subunit